MCNLIDKYIVKIGDLPDDALKIIKANVTRSNHFINIKVNILINGNMDECAIVEHNILVNTMAQLMTELYAIFQHVRINYPTIFPFQSNFTIENSNDSRNALLASYCKFTDKLQFMNTFQLDNLLWHAIAAIYVIYR